MKTHPTTVKPVRKAFTLVELLAAMVVMIFVALIIGTASSAFYNAWKRSVRLAAHLNTCQNIDRVMDVTIRNMIAFPWQDESDNTRIVFEGKTDSLFFTSRRRLAKGDNSAFFFIRLKLEDEKLVAEYHTLPRFPWTEEEKYPMEKEVLAENVKSISFLYAKLEDEEVVWEEEWTDYDPETLQENESDVLMIPLAVQLTVEWNNGEKEVWLRRTAGASRYTRFGSGQGIRSTSTGLRSSSGRRR
ncbi:MAG: type II secretion system protein [Lentisphaeria bacterium]|nr:type II secretion system protein [Lentisphaeria bacterium]